MSNRAARHRSRLLRPSGFDELGLRRAVSDGILPVLVGAMAFLASLALAGAVGAAALAGHWEGGAGSALTVQVPRPRPPSPQIASPQTASPPTAPDDRLSRVLAILRGTPGVLSAHALTDEDLGELLRPWLGAGVERLSLPLPDVIEVRLATAEPALDDLAGRLEKAVPGTQVESHGAWLRRLTALARSLQACAGAALLVVAGVAAAVISVATRAGLTARRDAIGIVHGLGATDGYIAGRFARRAAWLAGAGALAGTLAALPVLLWLSALAAPFAGSLATAGTATVDALGAVQAVPGALWASLPMLPVAAVAIGWATAQATVRRWLRRLP